VVRASPLFDEANLGALRSPKVRVYAGDAYRLLLRSPDRYDAIISEPSNPWTSGVEMLFAREFLEAAKSRLRPGGAFVQWMHVYETDAQTIALVLRTYAAVFDHVVVWYGTGVDLLLIGLDDPERALDLDRIEERAASPTIRPALIRGGVASLPALLAHELLPLGVVRAAGLEGDLHTLGHPLLGHRAARAFFRGASAELPNTATPAAAETGARNSLLRRLAARSGGRLLEADRAQAARELCRWRPVECATFLASWQHDEPRSDALRFALGDARDRFLDRSLLEAQRLGSLGRLFGPGGEVPAASGPVRLDQVRRDTELFRTSYLHAAPFLRAALADAWRRCEGPPGRPGECDTERARADAVVGGLGAATPTATTPAGDDRASAGR
jgi:hypothetical protein